MDADFPILATVATEPSHAASLQTDLQAIGLNVSRSTLFRRIDVLVASGEPRSKDERGPDGRARRMLSLSKKGAQRLKTVAAELLVQEPLASPMFALALSSAESLQDAELTEVLRTRMAAAARTLTQTERTLSKLTGQSGFWVRTSQERQVAHMKADLSWFQSVMRRKNTEEPSETQSSRLAG